MSGYGGVEVAWRLICGIALTPWHGRTPDAFAMLVAMAPQAVCVLAFSDELTAAAARRGLTAWRFGSAARWARNACLKAVLHPALAMLFGQAAGITTLVLSTGTVGGAWAEGYLPAIALTCALTPMLCLLTSTLALRAGEVEAAALVLGLALRAGEVEAECARRGRSPRLGGALRRARRACRCARGRDRGPGAASALRPCASRVARGAGVGCLFGCCFACLPVASAGTDLLARFEGACPA